MSLDGTYLVTISVVPKVYEHKNGEWFTKGFFGSEKVTTGRIISKLNAHAVKTKK